MPDSPTFVLVHGMGCNAAVWSPTVRELALRSHARWPSTSPVTASAPRSRPGHLGPHDAGLLFRPGRFVALLDRIVTGNGTDTPNG